MKKKILIIAATHGDEKIGLEVYGYLSARGLEKYFDLLIANPPALAANKRFLDCDLNRSYPGNLRSPLSEKRLAAQNLALAQKYRYVIDLHEACSGTDDFIIVPRRRLAKNNFLGSIPLERVLLWPEPRGPLGDVLPRCIELEFGLKGKNRAQVVARAARITAATIKNLCQKQTSRSWRQTVYSVYGELPLSRYSGSLESLRDFQPARVNGENFYPLLVGQYLNLKNQIVCYKMRKEKEPSDGQLG